MSDTEQTAVRTREEVQMLPKDLLDRLRPLAQLRDQAESQSQALFVGFMIGVGHTATPLWNMDLEKGVARRVVMITEDAPAETPDEVTP